MKCQSHFMKKHSRLRIRNKPALTRVTQYLCSVTLILYSNEAK